MARLQRFFIKLTTTAHVHCQRTMMNHPPPVSEWEAEASRQAYTDGLFATLVSANSSAVQNEALPLLLKILANILKVPCQPKFLRLPMENKALVEKLWPMQGMFDFLTHLGFRLETDEQGVSWYIRIRIGLQHTDTLHLTPYRGDV